MFGLATEAFVAPLLFLSNMFALYGSTVLLHVCVQSKPLLEQTTTDDGLMQGAGKSTITQRKDYLGISQVRRAPHRQLMFPAHVLHAAAPVQGFYGNHFAVGENA